MKNPLYGGGPVTNVGSEEVVNEFKFPARGGGIVKSMAESESRLGDLLMVVLATLLLLSTKAGEFESGDDVSELFDGVCRDEGRPLLGRVAMTASSRR